MRFSILHNPAAKYAPAAPPAEQRMDTYALFRVQHSYYSVLTIAAPGRGASLHIHQLKKQ